MTRVTEIYDHDGPGCADPKVDIAKVQDYVDWKQSHRYRVYSYIIGPHRIWAYWWRLHGRIIRWVNKWWPEPKLNRMEKIRAGLLLGQHRSPGVWLDGSICQDG